MVERLDGMNVLHYNRFVMTDMPTRFPAALLFAVLAALLIALPVAAQDAQQPQVKVNYLNVCALSEAESQEMTAALDRVPAVMKFSPDFEITRGSATMRDVGSARYVRLRREPAGDSPFATAQYSISRDGENTVETLVFRLRDTRAKDSKDAKDRKDFSDLLMISIEDSVSSAAGSPALVLQTDTPASRIKLERFGKPSLVLARCPQADQSSLQPFFQRASNILTRYRKSLGLHSAFRSDVAWLTAKPAASKAVSAKPKSPPASSGQKKSPGDASTPASKKP